MRMLVRQKKRDKAIDLIEIFGGLFLRWLESSEQS